ncbi:hypothetical protein UN33_23210 [Salmonella enterica subsp. enterica serovar Braenderup]|nr:hypothetical protein [Salmonella enterica]EBV6512526.1 hypothetical protein [Salmonella enterica subsp. enterica serovar Braenderup]EFN6682828.1 hypothetical protein [Escherichia coli O179:H8]PVS13632.1 hypothetical protein C4664_23145 [Salmonella enterica subsp. enterica serovar Kiambu]EBV6540621.1 hypothetical protein [Salmonella enterica subsp. enterica serovar Braenderup]
MLLRYASAKDCGERWVLFHEFLLRKGEKIFKSYVNLCQMILARSFFDPILKRNQKPSEAF